MALHVVLLFATSLAVARADQVAAADDQNAQNDNAFHTVLSAMVHTMVTAAFPLVGEGDRAEDALERPPLGAFPGGHPSSACFSEDCTQEGAGGGRRAQREALAVESAPLDALIDFAIGFAVHKYALLRGGRIPMEDIGAGRLRLREGSIGDLRDVFRKEPVALRRALLEGRPALLLSFSGGFRHVDVRYRYLYSIPLISRAGDVQGSLSPVVVVGQLLLQLPCRARLVRLNLSEVGELRLNGTGFWPLNGVVFSLLRDIADKTARRALLKVVDDIRKQIQGEFDAMDCSL